MHSQAAWQHTHGRETRVSCSLLRVMLMCVQAGVVRICGVRTLPSHRQLGLAAVILASTAYFAMEVGDVAGNDGSGRQEGSCWLIGGLVVVGETLLPS